MMGRQGSRQDQLFYAFNLEEHVPRTYLLRAIDRFFDLGELPHHLAAFYSHTGRPSIDPELMIRMPIVGYCSAFDTFAAVYSPPALDRRATLTAGGTATVVLTGTAVSSSPTGSKTNSFNSSEVWTFANRKIVSVPAGQYPTCKYQHSIVNTPGLTTDWLLDGNGVLLERAVTDSTGGVVSFQKATSVTIKGIPR
jgi:hypothetical protein